MRGMKSFEGKAHRIERENGLCLHQPIPRTSRGFSIKEGSRKRERASGRRRSMLNKDGLGDEDERTEMICCDAQSLSRVE